MLPEFIVVASPVDKLILPLSFNDEPEDIKMLPAFPSSTSTESPRGP